MISRVGIRHTRHRSPLKSEASTEEKVTEKVAEKRKGLIYIQLPVDSVGE